MLSLGRMRKSCSWRPLQSLHRHMECGLLVHSSPKTQWEKFISSGHLTRLPCSSTVWRRSCLVFGGVTSGASQRWLYASSRLLKEYPAEHREVTHHKPHRSHDDIQLPKRFPNVASLYMHVTNVISSEFPEQRPARLAARRTRTDEWECRLKVDWPETNTFVGKSRNKREAIRLAKAGMIRLLQERGLLSPAGEPVLYSRQELGDRLAALRQTPLLQLPQHVLPEVGRLYQRLQTVQQTVEEEQMLDRQLHDGHTEATRAGDGRMALFGGPERRWPAERRQERSERLLARLRRRHELAQQPGSAAADCHRRQSSLPVTRWRSQILSAVEQHRVVIVKGETGSGKSTQVPQQVLDAWTEQGRGADCNVVVTQPRRISAVSLARRVAELRGEQLRESVGYQVRLDSCLPRERGGILFCTIGILLARLQQSADLSGISHLVIDEVHERSVETDVLLLLVKRLLEQHQRLRVVLMSASVDTSLFSEYFGGAPVLEVPGRLFPVQQHFLEELPARLGAECGELRRRDGQPRPVFAAEPVARVVAAVCRRRPPGAVLVFLEGMAEIKQVEEQLRQLLPDRASHWVLPVSGRLSSAQQQAIFSQPPPGVRKVVLATNVAETGITVDDVVYVVDTGAVKQARLDPESGVSCLRTEWISQASAAQRQGRAGRVQPGEIYRLYSRRRLAEMDQFNTPELLRAPLETVVLDAKHLCAETPAEEFLGAAIEPPPPAAVRAALAELATLQMVDERERLTPLGRLAAQFELHPRQVRLLVYGVMLRCVEPALTLVGWDMSGREPYNVALELRPRLLDVKRRYSTLSDQEVAVRLFRGFLSDVDQRQYCEHNMLFRNGMATVKSLVHMVRSQLQQTGLVGRHQADLTSPDHPLNQLSDQWAVVTGALIAGYMKNVARVQRGTVAKGRLKPNEITVRCSDGAADPAGDSVNRRPGGQLPFLLYGSAFFSGQRRRRVLRDTTQASALQVALFYGDRDQALSVDADSGLQTLRVSCGGQFPLHVTASPSTVRCVQQLRAVLQFSVWHQLEARDSPGSAAALADVCQLHQEAVCLVAVLLRDERRAQKSPLPEATQRSPPSV